MLGGSTDAQRHLLSQSITAGVFTYREVAYQPLQILQICENVMHAENDHRIL